MDGFLERADSGIVHDHKTSKEYGLLTTREETPQCHPLSDDVSELVNNYVLENWDFEDEMSKQKFLHGGISRLACLYFPLALDERIWLIARLFSVVFLIEGTLASLDPDDGEGYVEALEAAVKGHWLPNDDIPAVWMMCGIFDEMRAQDYILVDDIVDTTFAHLSATLIRRGRPGRRHDIRSPSKTFRVGTALLSALSPFAMGFEAGPEF